MVIKTICIPIAECTSHSKQELYKAIKESLRASLVVANYAATECLRQDNLLDEKCSKLYTYPACKALYEGCSFLASSICRAVESAYKQDRWQVKNGRRASRTYRSMPWPLLHNASAKTFRLHDCGEYLTADIKLLTGWVTIRLAGGSNYRDQIAGLRKAMTVGNVCDSKMWLDRKGKAILGISVKLPSESRLVASDATILVSSTLTNLISITVPKSSVPFVLSGSDMLQWKEESTRRNQKFRQDRKQGIDKKRLRQQSQAFAGKMNRRLKTKIHELSSRVISKALQHRAGTIEVDFTIKSFCQSFPWFDLMSKIKYKAESKGLTVIEKTQTVTEPDLGSPHVYFIYEPNSHRVKIGKTKGGKGRLESYMTMNPDCVVLAVDNQPQAKLSQRERHYHAMFDSDRITNRNKVGNEVFAADNVIAFLRATGWIGNAGNLTQIMQVLDVPQGASGGGLLQADSKCCEVNETLSALVECQEKARICGEQPLALASK